MPGPKTHDIFYKELKDKLEKKTLQSLPNYDKYSIFAQGHDFLMYKDFYNIFKLNNGIKSTKELQENHFTDFVYEYIKIAFENSSIEDEEVRLFIGPGYIMHHLLDAYTHPFIIYQSGDYVRDPKNKTWYHGIAESLIDIYMMKKREGIDPMKYPVYKDFIVKGIISAKLLDTIKFSFGNIYNMPNADKIFEKAFYDVALYMRIFKYDPKGIKRILFDFVDPITKSSASFSYHHHYQEAEEFLNEQKENWKNPMFLTESNTSFIEL